MRIRHNLRAAGFTLIEVLVAMAILGMIIVAIYSCWMSIVRGQKIGIEAAADVQRARMAVQCIDDALAGAQMFTENMPYYAFTADTSDADLAALAFTSYLPTSFPGNGKFPKQPLRGVTFFVKREDVGPGNKLMLGQMPLLAAEDAKPYELTLAHNITLFHVQFLDSQVNPPEWVDDWERTNSVPVCVRVTLGFGVPGKGVKGSTVIHRTVSIPAVAVTRQYQAPDIGGGAGGVPGGGRPGGGGGRPPTGGGGFPGGGNPGGGNPGGGNPGGIRPGRDTRL